jgi:hypothetical protein
VRHAPAGPRLNPGQFDREPLLESVRRQTFGEAFLDCNLLDEIGDGAVRVQPDWRSRAAAPRLLARRSLRVAARARCFDQTSSNPFASQTVQVTIDAKARPIMTVFTTMPAFRNIDHGDRSLGNEPIV